MSALFSPLTVGTMTVSNRVAIAPMCQYSSDDGCASDWHLQQVMNYAMSGAAMVTLEAAGVERRGRISHGCLGLYSDANEAALARVLAAARKVAIPGTKFGIQLAHAGRKASTQRPWDGGGPLPPEQDPWQTVAPSAIPFAPKYHTPKALTVDELALVRAAFVQAAQRCQRLGFDYVELHSTHGYLLDEFLSPHSNQRTDDYGGSRENRMRFPLEVARAVRAAVPAMVVGARITGTDWTENGWSQDDAAVYAAALKDIGIAFVSISTGGNVSHVTIPQGLGYQVPPAAYVHAKVPGLVTMAAGHIVDATQAEEIVASGKADMVALARAFLDNPRWVWHAADRLGAKIALPPQYARASASLWKAAPFARPLDFKAN